MEVANTIPRIKTMIPPAVPIRLMTALALERRGFTVTSGMRATAGERKVAMAMSTTSRVAIKPTRGQMLVRVSSQVSFCNASAASPSTARKPAAFTLAS